MDISYKITLLLLLGFTVYSLIRSLFNIFSGTEETYTDISIGYIFIVVLLIYIRVYIISQNCIINS